MKRGVERKHSEFEGLRKDYQYVEESQRKQRRSKFTKMLGIDEKASPTESAKKNLLQKHGLRSELNSPKGMNELRIVDEHLDSFQNEPQTQRSQKS